MKKLELAYEECRDLTKREAKNFYYAFITLPPGKRRAIYAAYAFCRLCDDAVDEERSHDEKRRSLEQLRHDLSAAYGGKTNGHVFTALADSTASFNIPEEYFQEVVSGVETDLTKSRYHDFSELRTYCYQVASVVGLICIQIFGYSDARAREHAIDLGLAMQLTNILRDVKEDLERDRIYLPLDEIERFGYSAEELRSGVVNDPFRQLMEYQAQRGQTVLRQRIQAPPIPHPPLPGLSGRARTDLQPHPRSDRNARLQRFRRKGSACPDVKSILLRRRHG